MSRRRAVGEVFVAAAVRTPVGAEGGALRHWHPVDLGAEVLRHLAAALDLDPGAVDDVVFGCAMPIGEQGLNLARSAALGAGWPEHVPGMTVERDAAGGQQAVHLAAQAVASGGAELVVAGGAESQSRVPLGATSYYGPGKPYGPRMLARFHDRGGLAPPGAVAESIAQRWALGRAELDGYVQQSHARARAAEAKGAFDGERCAVPAADGSMLAGDERLLLPFDAAAVAGRKPAFSADGRITSDHVCAAADGAGAALIVSETALSAHRWPPLGRIAGTAVVGGDPRDPVAAAAAAARRALQRAGLSEGQIDVVEVHESSASEVLAVTRALGIDPGVVNPSGGALAIGHPGGAGGVRLMVTLGHELRRLDGRWGLQVMGHAGGATALVLERT